MKLKNVQIEEHHLPAVYYKTRKTICHNYSRLCEDTGVKDKIIMYCLSLKKERGKRKRKEWKRKKTGKKAKKKIKRRESLGGGEQRRKRLQGPWSRCCPRYNPSIHVRCDRLRWQSSSNDVRTLPFYKRQSTECLFSDI